MNSSVSTISELLDYWIEKRGARIAPTRAEMEPLDFPKLWADIIIYKVHHDPLDYEVTRFGTELATVWGKDYTGCFFDEIFFGSTKDLVRTSFDEAVRSGIATIEVLDARWVDKKYVKYKRLMLPLSEDGKTIDRLFLCVQLTAKD